MVPGKVLVMSFILCLFVHFMVHKGHHDLASEGRHGSDSQHDGQWRRPWKTQSAHEPWATRICPRQMAGAVENRILSFTSWCCVCRSSDGGCITGINVGHDEYMDGMHAL
jgi:hypothetical protein